jgi:hypothetical protein
VKLKIRFKDPDIIYEIVSAKHPMPDSEDDITPRMEREQEKFRSEYFEYGDYGCLEFDTDTMTAVLLPRKKWK